MSLLDKTSLLFVPCAAATDKVYGLIPSGGDADFTFSRLNEATVVNYDGKISNMPKNLARIDYSDGGLPNLLLEPERTNEYLNSDVLVNQDVTTVNDTYTLSFYGTGTVDLNGTFMGSLVGSTGRVSLTFNNPIAGTLNTTVTGNVTNAQLELGTHPTSYIPTDGSTVTRNADFCYNAGTSAIFNDNEGVLFADVASLSNDGNNKSISISDGTDSNKIELIFDKTVNRIVYDVKRSGATESNIVTDDYNALIFNKIAIKYAQNNFELWINGTKVDEVLSGSTPIGLSSLSFHNGNSINPFFGKTNSLAYFNTALTDSELQQLTQL